MQNSTSWTVGKIAGTPINVRPSALLLIVVFSALYFPTFAYYFDTSGPAVISSVVLALVLVLSVFLHEVAHVLSAKAFGVPAVEIGLTFFGGHAGFKREFSKPWHSFVVSVSGPLTNLVLGGLLLVVASSVEVIPETLMIYLITQVAGTMNLFLGGFNLLPGLPLDGGNALSALIWGATKKKFVGIKVAARAGQIVCVVWLAVALVLPLIQGREIDTFAIMWTLLIVWVLWSGAKQALVVAKNVEKMARVDVQALKSPVILASGNQPIGTLTSALMSAPASSAIIVVNDAGEPAGFVDAQALMSVPADQVEQVPVNAVTVPLKLGSVVAEDVSAESLVRAIQIDGELKNLFVLMDQSSVVGVVWVANLIRAINLD